MPVLPTYHIYSNKHNCYTITFFYITKYELIIVLILPIHTQHLIGKVKKKKKKERNESLAETMLLSDRCGITY